MARTAKVADLVSRLESLEAKYEAVRTNRQISKGARKSQLRSIKLAAAALTAQLRRSDALDPRGTISLDALQKSLEATPEAQGIELPKVGEIASIGGRLVRVVA